MLNTFQKKGYIFKTYEGKIIQSGFKANVQSNEFEFSVVDDKVATILLKNPGRDLVLHYKSYFGALPWRGLQADIVDSVYEVRDGNGRSVISIQRRRINLSQDQKNSRNFIQFGKIMFFQSLQLFWLKSIHFYW